MKLIIDIPKGVYEMLKTDNTELGKITVGNILSAVVDGTPLEAQPNRCESCTHSEEQDGSNCYECVKGMADNFEAQTTDAVDKRSLDSVIDTLQTWIRTADDEYDREEYWRVQGLREALHEIKKIKMFESSINVVDRDAVINFVKYSLCDLKRDGDKQIFINTINNLPSVTPKIEPCEDCISREAVIEWLKDKDIIKTKNQEENARRELAKLSPVTPQKPRGRWIHPYKSDITCGCSECHIQMPITNYYHYCPNCGAEMSEDCGKQNL